MQTIIVIWGFMGPLILGCIIGIFYWFFSYRKKQQEDPGEAEKGN